MQINNDCYVTITVDHPSTSTIQENVDNRESGCRSGPSDPPPASTDLFLLVVDGELESRQSLVRGVLQAVRVVQYHIEFLVPLNFVQQLHHIVTEVRGQLSELRL